MSRIQELLDLICGNKYTLEWKHLNFRLIPVTAINAEPGTEVLFNELYQALLNSNFEKILRTKSGGISVKKEQRLYHYSVYDIKQYSSVIEITLCIPAEDGIRSYRIQYRNNNYIEDKDEKLITGTQAFNIFKGELLKDGIDLEQYAVSKEEGERLNKEITPPDNKLFSPTFACATRSFKACHLDFHKFYMSGLLVSHPEMANTINRIASWAKTNPVYKTVLAATIGKFHSQWFNYKYANLAKDAINTAYKRYYEVMKELSKSRRLLSTNTDGIWYEGEEWHGIYESPELGGWSNDYVDVELRFKSAGSYEFRKLSDKSQYMAKVKGRTNLDKIKSRDNWEWGDIFTFSAQIQAYTFEKGVGIVWQKIM